MKQILFTLVFALMAMGGMAQERFTGTFRCKELDATLVMDLTEKSIPLKDLDFDETHGFMKGNLNGTWVILKVKKAEERKAMVRMVSDMGVDAQDVELRLTDGGDVELRLVGDQNVKMVQERKYVKMPKVVTFTRDTP